jgi:hypothetical protein
MKKLLLLAWLALSLPLAAQTGERDKKHNIRLGFEAGVTGYFTDMIKPEQLREFNSGYDVNFGVLPHGSNLSMESTALGVKSEIFLGRNRWGLSSGLRFSRYEATFKSRSGPFYWRLKEEDQLTDYVAIDKFLQQTYFLGVPLEVRFFPNRRDLPVQTYFKVGATFNYRLWTDNDISFDNPSQMNKYAGAVSDGIEPADRFHVYAYPAFGFKIGRYRTGHSPWFNVEINIPGMLFHAKASSFAKYSGGFGINLTAQIPLGRMAPIGSNYIPDK